MHRYSPNVRTQSLWKCTLLALTACAALGASAGRASAAFTIYDSTGSGNFGIFGLLSNGTFLESFSTGADPVELTSVTVVLSKSANDSGITTATLLADAGASPAAALTTIGTVDNSSSPNGVSAVTFTPTSPYLLAANTRYWVQLTEPVQPGGAGMGWDWTFHTEGLGVLGEYAVFNGSVHPTSTFGSYLMRVDVAEPSPTPVIGTPAPSGLILLGSAAPVLAGFLNLKRRKRPTVAHEAETMPLECGRSASA